MATRKRRQERFTVASWGKAMQQISRLETRAEERRFELLLRAVDPNASSKWFLAILDAIVLPEDHGCYERLHNTLWSFTPSTWGRGMVAGLPKLLRRMNRHDQVERFVGRMTAFSEYEKSFVAAFRKAPAADQKSIRRAIRGWSRGTPDWEPLLVELGGKPIPPAKAQPAEADPEWPEKWRRFYAQASSGRARLGEFWNWRSHSEAARFAAHLLSLSLGKNWRQAEVFTNPLFISFAGEHFDTFLDELKKLPPAARRTALEQLVKVGRHQPAMDTPKHIAKAQQIERLHRRSRSGRR